MRLLIAAVGKLKQGPERELCAHYLGRAEAAGRALGFAPLSLIEVPESKGATAASRRKQEATALLAKLPSPHKLICLDRTGEAMSSEAFAQGLAKVRDEGARALAFLIGGVVALLSTYSYAKLGAAFPSAGGAVHFLVKGFGDGVIHFGLTGAGG